MNTKLKAEVLSTFDNAIRQIEENAFYQHSPMSILNDADKAILNSNTNEMKRCLREMIVTLLHD